MIRFATASVLIAVASLASNASADTIQGRNTDSSNGYGQGNNGGYQHKFWGGTGAAARFDTGTTEANSSIVRAFCVDPNYLNSGSAQTYHLIRVTDAPLNTTGNASGSGSPNDGTQYTAIGERRLNAIALAAKDMGLIDDRGFLDASIASQSNGDNATIDGQTTTLARWIGTLQLLIWESLYENDAPSVAHGIWNLGDVAGYTDDYKPGLGNANQDAFNAITARAATYFNNQNTNILVRVLGVSIGTGDTNLGQDLMVLVPLPPAAWAGLGSLAGVLGFTAIRRRKLQAV
jgi:hypothetical protein